METTSTQSPNADPTTTNPERPAIYRVHAGRILNGATVTVLGMDGPSMVKAYVEEYGVSNPRQATVSCINLKRVFRSSTEKELGRDFSPEEVIADKLAWELRYAHITEERARTAIEEGIEAVAARLERAAADIRQELAYEQSDLAQKVQRVQHAVVWLFPNLAAHDLTREAVAWTGANRDIKRLEPMTTAEERAS